MRRRARRPAARDPMKKGFSTIMSAQFFSSLADNALFVAAVELLRTSGGAPEWQRAALVPMFALFYVVLAPFVGAFADALPKGRVMFVVQHHQGGGLPDDAVRQPPAAVVRHRRAGRGGLLAGQVRHPDRAAAAVAAGQGQWLDRGPDDRLDHPGRAARRPAGRPARRADAAGPRPADDRHRHRHARPRPRSRRSSSSTCWRRCSTSASRAPKRRCSR